MRCQEVRGGVIIKVIINVLITAIIIILTAGPSTASLKTASKVDLGDKKGKDSKITLTQESAHFIPTEFSNNFLKQIDLAMKIKREELKKQGISSTQVNEITESNMTQPFNVTEEQMQKAAEILGKNKKF